MQKIFYSYFIVINLIGIYVMYHDKEKAKHGRYRTPEAVLWRVAIIGGAIGTTVAMRWFRHKTKHTAFRLGFPVLAAADVVLFLFIVLHKW